MFADITGENGLFLNMLDMASHYQVVFPVADKNPLTVFYGFLLGWCLTLGVPERLRFDLGGEFESSFSELAEQIGCRLLPAASVSPTQNAPCERAGGAWKYRARRLVDQFSIKWNDSSTKLWLCAVLNWSTNTAIGDSGHSHKSMGARSIFASPFSALVSCVTVSISLMILLISVVLPCWPKHRDRSSAPGTTRRSVVPSCPVPEVPIMLRHRFVLQSETKSCIGVGTTSERVSGRCVGWVQGLSLGTKVVQSCGSVIAMPLSRQLETTFDSRKWKSNSRGMIFTIPFVKQMNRHTSISVRLVCLVILSMEVLPRQVMFQ